MARLGLNVPPGFVIATTECAETIKAGDITLELWNEVESALSVLEKATGRAFGSGSNPLLLSVRSGAALSMPGMMNTVLGLGIDGGDLSGLEKRGELDLRERGRNFGTKGKKVCPTSEARRSHPPVSFSPLLNKSNKHNLTKSRRSSLRPGLPAALPRHVCRRRPFGPAFRFRERDAKG